MHLLQEAIDQLDKDAPGRGIDQYDSKLRDHAMAYGLLTSAAVLMQELEWAKRLAEWSLSNVTDNEATFGWGLGFEWNAFGKLRYNPEDAVYGITQAIVVKSLLDLYDATNDDKYLVPCLKALNFYSSFFTETENGGFFWYSDQSDDNKNVHNVSIMLAAQYARIGFLVESKKFLKLAKMAYKDFISAERQCLVFRYWNYSSENQRANDLVHACYTSYGAATCAKYLDEEYNLEEDLYYLKTFITDDTIMEYSPAHHLEIQAGRNKARLWGIGMAVFVCAEVGDKSLCKEFISALHFYRDSKRRFLSQLNRKDVNEPRSLSHVILGLANYDLIIDV